jgi:hypothetical protein
MNRIAEDVYEGAKELWLCDIDPYTGRNLVNDKDKGELMKQVTQKDVDHVEELWSLDKFSIQRIAEITKRTWSTVKAIIDSGFNLIKYKQLTKQARTKRYNSKKLTFRPFNEPKAPGPVKVQEIPVEPIEAPKTLDNMNDVLDYMWNKQQDGAKELVHKAERDEAIHKIRNGLQKISEGLGELL